MEEDHGRSQGVRGTILHTGQARLAAGDGELLQHGDPFGGETKGARNPRPEGGSIRDCKRPKQAWKVLREFPLAQRRHHCLARRAVPAQPLAPDKLIGKRGAEGAAEVGPAFAPVEAAACEVPPLALRRSDVDAEILQESAPLGADAEVAVLPPEQTPLQQRVGEGRSEEHTSELQSLMRLSY